uniref:Membrane protein n=1 Tax=uncultured organism TaxID=155900 RepID=M1Q1J0_9ZZZZ|nr:membrane protein [uncultured organism]
MDLREKFEEKNSEELKEIYKKNDRTEWRPKTFEVIQRILEERGEEIPDKTPVENSQFMEEQGNNQKESVHLAEEDILVSTGLNPAILGIPGFLAIILGILLLWGIYAGETTGSWFSEVSSILLINLGFIGVGFSALISVVKKGVNKQNRLLFQLLKSEKEE